MMSRPRGELVYKACIAGTCEHTIDDSCPRAGQKWPNYVRHRAEHDQTCKSLLDMWAPSYGGVSCPSDLFLCDDCKIMFFNEGMRRIEDGQIDPDDGEFMDLELCECCYRKRDQLTPHALQHP